MNKADPYRQTCCGLIHCVYKLLSSSLKTSAIEMIDETGDGGLGLRIRLEVREVYGRAHAILSAKEKLYTHLKGEDEDKKLLDAARKLITQLETDVMGPLRDFNKRKKLSANMISALGRTVNEIAQKAGPLALESESRLRPTLFSELKETKMGTVVSIDMSRYSQYVLDLTDIVGNSSALFELNTEIQDYFKKALDSLQIDPRSVPTQDTGDGALLFFETPEAAIDFARLVKSNVSKRNLDIRKARRKRRFRIGVATGEFTIRKHVDVLGHLREFRIAGLVIIDAVRIQAECPNDQILLSAESFNRLPPHLKSVCKEADPIQTKKHEDRTLSVFKIRAST